jgi:hypothetical protein
MSSKYSINTQRNQNYDAISKSEMKKKSVAECLHLIYENQVNEAALNDMSKEKLKDFILEIFNKGRLNDYLLL